MANHRKASILKNKQSLSSSQCSFLIFFFFDTTEEWKQNKQRKEIMGEGRRGQLHQCKPQHFHKSTANEVKAAAKSFKKCFHRSRHDSCQANKSPTREFPRHPRDSCFHSSLGWRAGLRKNNRMDSDRTLTGLKKGFIQRNRPRIFKKN